MKRSSIILFILSNGFKLASSVEKETKVRHLRGAQRYLRAPLNKFDSIKSHTNDYCAEMSLEPGNKVGMRPCNANGRENQNWFFDHETNEIINEENLKCLDVNKSDGSILAWDCHGRDNQKWESELDMLRSVWNGKCIQMDVDMNLFLSDCGNDQNQEFYINKNPAINWNRMRSLTDDIVRCVDISLQPGNNAYSHSCNEKDTQKWYFNKKSNQIINKANKMCLDVNTSNGNVLVWPCHGRTNQKWYWDSNSKLRSSWNQNCLQMNRENNNLQLSSCNEVRNQLFHI